jgi:hypothetical protein
MGKLQHPRAPLVKGACEFIFGSLTVFDALWRKGSMYRSVRLTSALLQVEQRPLEHHSFVLVVARAMDAFQLNNKIGTNPYQGEFQRSRNY